MGATTTTMPAIVGALRCQKDSYLQTLETSVISCKEYVPATTGQSDGKSKKSTDPTKGLANGASTNSKVWHIEFADSVLFPEGGGQHTDHGTLLPLSGDDKEEIPITNIQRHGLRCVHFSPKPLEPGTAVRQTVDFGRRWDLMQQHTGQHLLSAIMDGMDLETLGWSMGQPGEMNYVELPRKPTEEKIRTIQEECNRSIRGGVPITVETPEGKGSSSLPEDYDSEKGVVRFIKIGDLDYNACCGTHLRTTSHIGLILLHHNQTIRGTNCRLFFSAGDRAIKLATESINGLRSIAVSLSTSSAPADVAAGVQRLGDSLSEERKRGKKMLGEISKFESERITAHLQSHQSVFSHRTTDGLDFINLVVMEIKDFASERGVVVLCSGEVKTPGSIVILGKPDLVESMSAKIKDVLSTAKGGGKGPKWQGKVPEWQKGEIEALKAAVESV
ncbi:ThrRS/AlaRS common domain-containing protein [Plenodomus tracheiphilus IPT5]|uniref:ThrRS/AlaRS common domain-containing protein n=1 Tax=Plenodomus tracheiphilus IPT5 TaxID=1408161 RepID=A0A6A7BPD4_9PLEO|nr:ThrRS/AlaRS common domain-containing protein [Plenodomus tracheiphilus IPT5]